MATSRPRPSSDDAAVRSVAVQRSDGVTSAGRTVAAAGNTDGIRLPRVWRERDGDQHWKVFAVHNQVATLQRCTKGGQVLNPRYKVSKTEDQMHAQYVFVGPK